MHALLTTIFEQPKFVVGLKDARNAVNQSRI